MDAMTDLELIDYWIESGCAHFPDPRMFRHINSRGLYGVIDRLEGRTHEQMKASARARMAARGKYTGDPEIEAVASLMDRIGGVQKQLCRIKPSEAEQIKETAERLAVLANQLLNYFEK